MDELQASVGRHLSTAKPQRAAALGMLLRVSSMEQGLDEAARSGRIKVSDSVANGTVGRLLGLPPFLDAVVNKSNEPGGNDDAAQR